MPLCRQPRSARDAMNMERCFVRILDTIRRRAIDSANHRRCVTNRAVQRLIGFWLDHEIREYRLLADSGLRRPFKASLTHALARQRYRNRIATVTARFSRLRDDQGNSACFVP